MIIIYFIKDAKLRLMTEFDGVPCAEIGVLPAAVDDSPLLVYFVEGKAGEYKMVRMLHNDAHTEIDWYDNNMHNAFEDVKDKAFQSSTFVTADQQGAQFTQELLAFGNLREELAMRFTNHKNQ